MTNESYEGLQENIRTLELPKIDTWESKYPERGIWVEHRVPEFTCLCPKTGLPDFATINIRYVPDKLCIELKSLKLYMIAYRDVGIFHEHVVNKVLSDFVAACDPLRVEVVGEFNARGGIGTTVVAEYNKGGTDEGCECGCDGH